MKLYVYTDYSFAETHVPTLTVMEENLEACQWFYVELASSFSFSFLPFGSCLDS